MIMSLSSLKTVSGETERKILINSRRIKKKKVLLLLVKNS